MAQALVGGHQFFLDFGSSGDSCMAFSKNAESFSMIPKAASDRFNRLSLTSSWRRKRAISAWSPESYPIVSPGFLPANTPPSRRRRQSVICEENNPSRRKKAPPSLFWQAASYEAKYSSFCVG